MKRLSLFLLFVLFTSAAADQPNILFLFSDDHAVRTIGAYPGSINKTPNLDRIAKEGAIFRESFCVNSICCPSRAAILTGKHSHANGVIGNGAKWDGTQWVYPRALAKEGYQTAMFGKWHLKGNPTDEFQQWEILSGKGGQGSYFNPEFLAGKKTSKVEGYSTEIITNKALHWLEHRNKKKPFFLYVAYKVPHVHRIPAPSCMGGYDDVEIPIPATLFDDHATRSPAAKTVWMHLDGMKNSVTLNIAPTKEELAADPSKRPKFLEEMTPEQRDAWHKAYDPRNLEMRRMEKAGLLKGQAVLRYTYQRFIKDYIRCIDGLDQNVGKILDYLDKTGLAKNTIVVYSSDQGFLTGEHGWVEKRWMYEESFRAPLLMRWPGVIKPGTKIDALVQNIDLAPTFVTAAGGKVPKEVHGVALQPLLGGETPENWRKDILYQYFDGGIPGKSPGPYNMPRHNGVRDGRYKLIHFYDLNTWEFYDLQRDPNEIANRYNDPECKKVVERLKKRLQELKKEFDVPASAEK